MTSCVGLRPISLETLSISGASPNRVCSGEVLQENKGERLCGSLLARIPTLRQTQT